MGLLVMKVQRNSCLAHTHTHTHIHTHTHTHTERNSLFPIPNLAKRNYNGNENNLNKSASTTQDDTEF